MHPFDNNSNCLPLDRRQPSITSTRTLRYESLLLKLAATVRKLLNLDYLKLAATVRKLLNLEIFSPIATYFSILGIPYPFPFLIGFRRYDNATILRINQSYRRWGRVWEYKERDAYSNAGGAQRVLRSAHSGVPEWSKGTYTGGVL
jgi:hypothetical protein